jgi:type I restriction enzyme S subunit
MGNKIPEDWNRFRLGEIAIIEMGQSPSSTSYTELPEGFPFLQGNADFGARTPTPKTYCTQPTKICKKDDILISVRAPVGDLNTADQEYCIGRGLAAIRGKPAKVWQPFLFYELSSERRQLYRSMQGTTFEAVNSRDLKSTLLMVPKSLEEQKKISAILRCTDNAIDKTKELIEKYKKMKHGLMQDFFDSTENHIIDNRWVVIKLGNPEYFELATGGTPSTSVPEYWGGTTKWMTSGDVHKKKIYDVDGRITEKGYENSNATLIPKDSILIALAGQGKTRGTVAISKVGLTTNQSVAAVIPKRDKINSQYLYHYLDNKYLELRSISAGAGRAGLSLSILGEYTIKAPPNLGDQERIARVLDSIDEKIQSEESYRNKLVKMKAGLMQDLLTGKVRVAA